MKIKIQTVKCPFCPHEWIPRVAQVDRCPKCFKRFPEPAGRRRG